MQIIEKLEDFNQPQQPLVLTIGNFDGLHRGHRVVLQHAKKLVHQQGQTVVLTFSNHPSEVLKPDQPTQLLCTLPHKLRLLEQADVHSLILIPFTRYLAQHSAASFIERVRQHIPFSHLVLGHDATLGRDRQGDRQTMQLLGEQWGFSVHYVDEYRFEGQPVSSTRIRENLKAGNLEQVELLLNRPFSIYAPVTSGNGKGKQIGYPTANLEVTGLCVPPLGVYAIEVIQEEKRLFGIANLGIAPTVRTADTPLLEVHVFDSDDDLYGQSLEVIFRSFIRPEKKFESLTQLHQQITRDIEYVRKFFAIQVH